MIKIKREILGTDQENAVVKTMHFSTNFNGNCSITVTDYLEQEAREKGIGNGVNKPVSIDFTDEVKEKLETINGLVYDILNLQEEFKEGVEC